VSKKISLERNGMRLRARGVNLESAAEGLS
jgi:hypothetical protein